MNIQVLQMDDHFYKRLFLKNLLISINQFYGGNCPTGMEFKKFLILNIDKLCWIVRVNIYVTENLLDKNILHIDYQS